jgi:hypothetical protein
MRSAAGVELRADLLEGGFQGLGDEFFVEAAREGRMRLYLRVIPRDGCRR